MATSTRVMHLLLSFRGGGAERVVLNLVRHSVGDYEHSICVFDHAGVYADEIPQELSVYSLGEASSVKNAYITKLNRFRNVLQEAKPDIIQAHMIETHRFVALATLGWNGKLILTHHNNPSNYLSEKFRGALKRGVVRRWLRFAHLQADAVSAVSSGVMEGVVCALKCQRCAQYSIHNPVDTVKVQERALEPVDEAIKVFLQRYRLNICSMGRLHKQKGFTDLVRGFHAIREKFDCGLIIMGVGSERDVIYEAAKEMGVDEHLLLPGFVGNPWSVIKSCDVYCGSSKWEGFYLAAVEAMLCGTPCVLSDCDYGPREIVDHELDGFLFPVGSIEELSDFVCRLLGDHDLANSLSVNALNKAKQFSVEHAVRRHEAMYAEVLNC